MMSKIAHLKVYSKYSYTSNVDIEKLVVDAKSKGFESVAITDKDTMHYIVDFYEACIKHNMKPIFGLEVEVKDEEDQIFKMILLAKNNEGYRNLIQISTEVNNHKISRKGLISEVFLKEHSNHLFCIMSVEEFYLYKKIELLKEKTSDLKKIFGENLYFEIKDLQLPKDKKINNHLLLLSKELKVNLVAVNDVCYLQKEEAEVVQILKAIKKGTKIKQADTEERYLKTEEEMKNLFDFCPEALKNTEFIAENCNVEILLKGHPKFETKMPQFKVPKEFKAPVNYTKLFTHLEGFVMPVEDYKKNHIAYLCVLAWKGLKAHYRDEEPEKLAELKKLLMDELGVIIKKGFANYFLIVQDFLKYAKENLIPTGPGRGSVVSSLTARCLGITTVCPYEYGLFFERFLSEGREDNPDIDIDVSQEFRYKMFEYAVKTYGDSKVGKIVTFQNYGIKSAIMNVGKTLEIDKPTIDKINKSFKKEISELEDDVKKLQTFISKEPKIEKLIEYAKKIVGLPNNTSVHGAGIILSMNDLKEEVPLMTTVEKETGKEMILIQIANNEQQLEKLGFVKIDLLALKNLDVSYKTKQKVEEKGTKLTAYPPDDAKTFKLFSEGNLLGVFQLDSMPMRTISKAIKPQNLKEIMPILALYRPSAKKMIESFLINKARNQIIIYAKDGSEIKGVECLYPIVKDTYGVILYQEQISQILKTWAGYEMQEAEAIRRIISKKKIEKMTKERERFIERSVLNERDKETSEKLFETIEEFAQYGFNKAHTAAYIQVSFECAYLKANHPEEYMSFLISSEIGESTKKAAEYVLEAKRMGIEVKNPDINKSFTEFEPSKDSIEFGIAVIKNVGKTNANVMINERKKGKYRSFYDFLSRMKQYHSIDRKVIESLIKSGAFDSLNTRKECFYLLDNQDSFDIQISDPRQIKFSDIPSVGVDLEKAKYEPEIPILEDFPISEKLKFEKEVMYMTISPTPLQQNEKLLKLLDLKNTKQEKVVVGEIIQKTEILTKKSEKMAFIIVRDAKGKEYEVTVFPKQWQKLSSILKSYELYVFDLKSDVNDKFILQEASVFEDKILEVTALAKEDLTKEEINNWIKKMLKYVLKYKGEQEVTIQVLEHKKSYPIKLDESSLTVLEEITKDKASIKVSLKKAE